MGTSPRAQVSYQRRVDAVTELRRLVLEAERSFNAWVMGVSYEGTSSADDHGQGFYELAAKIDALASYYGVHLEWLTPPTRDAVETLTRELAYHNGRLIEARFAEDATQDEHEAAKAARRWHDQDFSNLLDNVQVLPRWRRLFGG